MSFARTPSHARTRYHRAYEAGRLNERPERHLASHVFNLAMMAVGGVALAWMIKNIGWDHFSEALGSIGWWFAVILALDLAALCFDAAALQAFMRPEARMVSYLRVLGAQASGRAINVLTPVGALGEATKLSMLVSHAPRTRVLSSIVLLNLSQFYLSVLIIVIGTPIMFMLVDIPASAKLTIGVGLGLALALVIALGVLVKRGAVTTVVDIIRGTRMISSERAERWREQLVEVDRHIRELYANRSHGTWKGFLWVLASRGLTWAATLVLLASAGVDVSPALVIGVFSIGVLIQWGSQIVPMGLGLADGGNYAMYGFLGATGAHGVVITMLNRGRSVAVAILGLAAMAVLHLINRHALGRMHRKLQAMRAAAADAETPAITAEIEERA
jgi:hypothetical protein